MRKRIHSRSELLIYIQGIRSLPKVFLEEMLTWEAIYKSPHSPSFYSCSEKRWDFTPVACKRVSNHWNFKSRRQPPAGQDLHCITDVPVKNHYFWTLAVYQEGLWQVQLTLPYVRRSDW